MQLPVQPRQGQGQGPGRAATVMTRGGCQCNFVIKLIRNTIKFYVLSSLQVLAGKPVSM
jgi:hypothetical protein